MGRGILQHAADDILHAVQPQDPHDSAHILSGASHKRSMYVGCAHLRTCHSLGSTRDWWTLPEVYLSAEDQGLGCLSMLFWSVVREGACHDK